MTMNIVPRPVQSAPPTDTVRMAALGWILWGVMLAWALSGCQTLKSLADDVPPPPSIDVQTCGHSHDEYLQLARRSDWLRSATDLAPTPQEVYDRAHEEFVKAGYVFLIKDGDPQECKDLKPGDKKPEHCLNTTLPGVLMYASTYPDKPILSKAVIEEHELVHLREYEDLGADVFLAMYAFGAGRLALEIPAYRHNFRVRRHFGQEIPRRALERSARQLSISYSIDTVPLRCIEQWAFPIWELG